MNMSSDTDARMHRIINNAKFEVEEIQRRHRQNETDAENLDKEMEKLRVEAEKVESQVRDLRDRTTQYEAEHERATRQLETAEDERKLLEETLIRKKEALTEFQRKTEEDDAAHDEMMMTYREKWVEVWEECVCC